MLYVALGHGNPTATKKEMRARRLEFQYPPEVHVLSEYWLFTDKLNVITAFETESTAAMMTALAYFDGLVDFEIYPAVTADEGLKYVKEMFGQTAVPA